MAYDETTAERVRHLLVERPDLHERKMMGGLAFMVKSGMCCAVSGRGGMLGLAQGAADIRLEDAPEGTLLSFVANGKADGGTMRLGKSLIGKSAQRVIDGFFESIGREMGAIVTALPAP